MSGTLTFTAVERGLTPKVAQRKQNDIAANAAIEIGRYWHSHFRLKHFTQEGGKEYGYAPRNVRYMIVKARTYGHRDPLVFTGLSRALSNLQDVRRVRAVRGEAVAKVVLHTPALNLIPKGGHINLRDEMTRTSQREADIMGGIGSASFERQYSALNEPSTTTNIG